MPELCRFHGIIIRMFYDEHEQPHFHAAYQGKVAQIGIDPLTIMHGRLHRRDYRAYNGVGDGASAGIAGELGARA